MHVVIHDEVDHETFPKLNSFNCDLGIWEDNIDRERYPDPTDHLD